MSVTVEATANAAEVIERAGTYLAARPVEHNLVLTLLHERATRPQPGRYWVAREGAIVVGVGFQSPLDFAVTLTPMQPEAAKAIAEAASGVGALLPGVSGEAGTAATFAGHWTEIHKTAARPLAGQRLYRLGDLHLPEGVSGLLRPANEADLSLVGTFVREFLDFIGETGFDAEVLTRRVEGGQAWLWEDGEPVCLALHSLPIEGVTRIQTVYTPPALRRRGYAGACVGFLSKRLRAAGHECVLYTDLGNPTPNSVYRKLGYDAVVEVLRYGFGEPEAVAG
ncbi:MAG: GNAT family N-acetyltransferase [Acidimicrobiales bacterium]|jgi:GNAT superfamily N-acetyltransferase